jgi:acyl-coenzyme A synthetase/AMP-(fatty) acid ligase
MPRHDAPAGESSGSVLDHLVRHAERSPDHIAVDTLQRRVTYAQLLGRVGHVAALLEGCPAGPVIVQPIDAIDQVIGCLAAMAQARTFLVVDRTLPQEALDVFAVSVGATVLLRPADDASSRAVPSTLTIIDVAGSRSAPLARTAPNGHPMAFASTSGSTGRPKLVSILEQEVLLVLEGTYGDADLLPSDVAFFPLSPATFTVVGVLRGVTLGITVVCADPRALRLADVAEGIRDTGVTFVRLAPSVLRRLVRSIPQGASLPAVRTVQCTGEPLLWSDIESLRRVLSPTAIVHNRLGMTETGELTVMPVRVHDPIGAAGAVPVGKALPGRRVLILGPDGAEVAAGMEGAIVLEGVFHRVADGMESLADGWTRFHTGDVGGIDASGDLVLFGRSDRMLKIGGVRVEPSLVEDAIRGLPQVVDAAVFPVPVAVGERRLAALVVTVPGSDVTVEQVRDAVQREVSAAAVPARIVLSHDPLPLLDSGKADLRRLSDALGLPPT